MHLSITEIAAYCTIASTFLTLLSLLIDKSKPIRKRIFVLFSILGVISIIIMIVGNNIFPKNSESKNKSLDSLKITYDTIRTKSYLSKNVQQDFDSIEKVLNFSLIVAKEIPHSEKKSFELQKLVDKAILYNKLNFALIIVPDVPSYNDQAICLKKIVLSSLKKRCFSTAIAASKIFPTYKDQSIYLMMVIDSSIKYKEFYTARFATKFLPTYSDKEEAQKKILNALDK
jgi:hypothetical protein